MPFWNAPENRANEALRRAIDQSLAVISFDPVGKILGANANFLMSMGYSENEVVGRHHSMFADEAYAQSEAYRAFWASLRAGHYEEGEFCRRAAGGREVWLRATYNPILDDAGKVIRIVKIATNITAEKHRAMDEAGQIAAIQRSQAVIAFAMDGTILEANSNFLSVMGYSLQEVAGRHHRMFVPDEEARSHAYEAFWQSLRRGEFQTAEYRRIAKGGREVWIRASYNPILDASGKPAKVVKFAMDVTAEKLRTADYEGQIKAVNRTQAVISFNLDGTILDANDNFLTAVGYGLEEVRGQHHRIFVKADYAQSEDYHTFWERLRSGEPVSAIYQRFGKGGRSVWLQATYNPILDALGRPIKIVKYATDISASMTARSRAIEAAEDTLNNVENVASAAEEMNASASTIAEGMMRTKQLVDEIHTRTSAADRSTIEMRQAAQSMTGVLDLITQITGQINLLALNATIESARAGEAGRGFAVVANEVKMLASQTSAATSRISGEIAAMQTMSDHVVSALNSITSVVDDVQGFVDEAAHSMQEQSQVTHDISANMHVAAEGVADIGRNLDDWIIGMEERRFEARMRTSKPAVIVCADGTRLSCSVRNISKSGAKLAMANARSVPDRFDLEIPSDGTVRKCTVARRGATEIGIRFVDEVQMPLAGAA